MMLTIEYGLDPANTFYATMKLRCPAHSPRTVKVGQKLNRALDLTTKASIALGDRALRGLQYIWVVGRSKVDETKVDETKLSLGSQLTL